MNEPKGPILHVLVVGFHHKKGCQVEYSFPALVPGCPNECPPGWKYLPTLALPDGSHNFDDDTAFFHLPSLTNPRKTIYGISCFRQIPVEKLKNRTEDITRGTVQKSVCVLSSLPLYGHIEVKMSLITHAYFDEGDFSKVSLLEDTYHHLNACLMQNNSPLQNFVGLSARDFILQWRHKAVLLYKLMLLERKLIFFKSPVQPLCTTILTLLSLHPGMIENGLEQSACIKLSRPMSPMPDFDEDEEDNNIPCKSLNPITIDNIPSIPNGSHCISSSNNNIANKSDSNTSQFSLTHTTTDFTVEKKIDTVDRIHTLPTPETNEVITSQNKTLTVDSSKTIDSIISKTVEPQSNTTSKVETQNNKALTVDLTSQIVQPQRVLTDLTSKSDEPQSTTTLTDDLTSNCPDLTVDGESLEIGEREEKTSLPRDSSLDTLTEHNTMTSLTHLTIDKCDIPLSLFSQGYLCLPYLSLPYIDLLTDVNVRGYIVGATNVLFKQKRNLADVLIEIDGARIESQDPELRKQLHLTTEDLRFADFVVKHVQEEKHDVFLDGVGWEGGDEWIRAQFRVYLLCLLRTSLLQEGSREIEHFNSSFMSAWKDTHNYKMWISGEHPGILEANPGHPFAGQLSVADMKLRFAHTMQNTESGRKINQAMASTGRAVATTGRAVGGAISHAKGALTNWWSNLLVSPDNRPAICEGEDVLHTIDKTSIAHSCQQEHENNQKNTQNIPENCEDLENSENIIMNGLLENEGDLLEKVPS